MADISIVNIKKAFEEGKDILDGVSFEVFEGSASASGKNGPERRRFAYRRGVGRMGQAVVAKGELGVWRFRHPQDYGGDVLGGPRPPPSRSGWERNMGRTAPP